MRHTVYHNDLLPAARIILLLLVIFTLFSASARQINELTVENEKGVYRVRTVFMADAPLEEVRGTLMDFVRLPEYESAIKAVNILEPPDKQTTRIQIILENCILLFCQNILIAEDISVDDDGDITARILPGWSDMRSGKSRWHFEEVDGSVKVSLDSEFEPDFWIPPLVGPILLQSDLKNHLRHFLENLEW